MTDCSLSYETPLFSAVRIWDELRLRLVLYKKTE